MALAPLAPVSALESRLGLEVGSLTGADLQKAEDCLADASTLARAEAGVAFLDDLGNPAPPEVVLVVVVRAAIRGYRNPEQWAQESTAGAYMSGTTPETSSVYLTDNEKALVRAAATPSNGGSGYLGAGSIGTPSPYGVRGYGGTLYAPTTNGSRPIPWEVAE